MNFKDYILFYFTGYSGAPHTHTHTEAASLTSHTRLVSLVHLLMLARPIIGHKQILLHSENGDECYYWYVLRSLYITSLCTSLLIQRLTEGQESSVKQKSDILAVHAWLQAAYPLDLKCLCSFLRKSSLGRDNFVNFPTFLTADNFLHLFLHGHQASSIHNTYPGDFCQECRLQLLKIYFTVL